MDDKTSWTPTPDDNKLGLTDKNIINEYEAKGLIAAGTIHFKFRCGYGLISPINFKNSSHCIL